MKKASATSVCLYSQDCGDGLCPDLFVGGLHKFSFEGVLNDLVLFWVLQIFDQLDQPMLLCLDLLC